MCIGLTTLYDDHSRSLDGLHKIHYGALAPGGKNVVAKDKVSARISGKDLDLIDQLVSEGKYSTRSDFIRCAILSYLQQGADGIDHMRVIAERITIALRDADLLKGDT